MGCLEGEVRKVGEVCGCERMIGWLAGGGGR
jgi:hypothetical protein